MVRIFDIEDGAVVLTPSSLLIPEVRVIKEKYPDQFMDIIAFCTFMRNPYSSNPYANLFEYEKIEQLEADYVKGWNYTDIEVVDLLDKLETLYNTPVNKYYQGCIAILGKLANYAKTVEVSDDKEGNIQHLMRFIKDSGATLKQFTDAQKVVVEEEAKAKGNRKTAYDL